MGVKIARSLNWLIPRQYSHFSEISLSSRLISLIPEELNRPFTEGEKNENSVRISEKSSLLTGKGLLTDLLTSSSITSQAEPVLRLPIVDKVSDQKCLELGHTCGTRRIVEAILSNDIRSLGK